MPDHKISDLRAHLFETLERLKDKDHPMDIARAKAVSDVAQTIINSARVEIELVQAVQGSRPGNLEFFGIPEDEAENESPVKQLPSPTAKIAKREKLLNERMPWPDDYTHVEPLARKAGA